jgi:hypothetical protein
MAQLRDRIDAQKTAVASATAEYVKLGGTFKDVAKAAETVKKAIGGASFGGGDFKDLPKKATAAEQALAGMRATIAEIPAPVLAAAGAWLAFVGATVAATAALLRYGVASSDVRRTEQLRLEGLMTIRRWHGVAAGSIGELTGAIDRTAASSALARGAVSGYAEQLYRAGLRGGTLTKALEAVTMTASVQGPAMAARMAGMSISFARTGRSVDALAEKVRSRLGGIAARQMLSLDVQSRKLEESLQFLTGGLRLEGFLGALNEVTQLLSANTSSGRALKTMFEALFNPMLDGLQSAGPLAKRFFQGAIIAALELTIAVLKIGIWFKRTFGADVLGGIDKTSLALKAGMLVVSMLAGALIVTAAAAGLLAAALGLVIISALIMTAPLWLAVAAFVWLGSKVGELVEKMIGLDWNAVGQSLVDGLLGSIVRGSVRVIDAVRGLAINMKDAMKDALGIASPSRVFASLGVQIPRGLAAGVEAGAPAAQSAVDGLVRVPSVAPAGGAAGRSGEGARTVSIAEIHIHASTSDPQELAESFRDQVARLFEDLAIEMGAPA